MNELIWIISLLISLAGIFAFYKLFGKIGLYIWSAMAIIIANIQVVKIVNLFGMETGLGIIAYSSIFLVANILIQKYGEKEARKALLISLTTMIVFTILMGLATLYKPTINDIASNSMILIFSINLRITIGSIVAYLVSQSCNMIFYQKLREKYQRLWISNNGSALLVQLIDTIVFLLIAFAGTYSFKILLQMFIARYILKVIVSACGTPILYMTSKLKEK